jgi:glucose-fructose oxidoreductase
VGRYPDVTVAPALKLAQGAELAAVYSRTRQTGEEFARKHGAAAVYDSLDALLDDPQVAVVYICSPNQLHAEYTERAARAGKHVLVEKPMALNLADGLNMVRTCEAQGVKLGVGFQLRLHPGRIEARRRVLAGELGTIALAQANFGRGIWGQVRPEPQTGRGVWLGDPALVGGAHTLMGQGVHCIDDLLFLLGQQVVEVAAITDGQTSENPLENLAAVSLRFDGGTIGMICSGLRMPEFVSQVSIYGSEGKAILEEAYPPLLQGALRVNNPSGDFHESYPADPLALPRWQIEQFNRVVAGEEEPTATGWDGLRVVQVTSAIIESATEGRTVKLEPLAL